MAIPMIKHNGKMVPAKKDKNGKWVPMEGAELEMTKEGTLEVKKKSNDE